MKRPAKYRQMANELAPDLTGRKPDASLRSIRGGRPGSMEVLIGSDAIQSRVREIGKQIARDHPAGVPLLVGALRGSVTLPPPPTQPPPPPPQTHFLPPPTPPPPP